MAKVSIIIPAYNSANVLGEAIESLNCQNWNDYEIIVVNDGSTDNTQECIQPYIERGQVIYVEQSNQGPGAARNRGFFEANGNYVAFLDADDTLAPSSIGQRVDFLDRYPRTVLVFTDLWRVLAPCKKGEIFFRTCGFLNQFAEAIIKERPPEYVFSGAGYRTNAIRFFPYIKTPTVMVRRSALVQAGPFDTKLRAAEDVDMWLRLSLLGDIGYIDRPLTYWNHYRSGLTLDGAQFHEHCARFYNTLLSADWIESSLISELHRRIAAYWFFHGYHHFDKGELKQARKSFARSVWHRHGGGKELSYLVLSCLPLWLCNTLRSAKQAMSK